MATPLFCSINYQYMSDLHCNSCLERITFNIICMRTVKMKKKTYETLPFFFATYDMNMIIKYWFFSIRFIQIWLYFMLKNWSCHIEKFLRKFCESLVNSRWQAVNEFVREEFSFGYLEPEVEQPYLTNSTEDAPLELTTLLCVLGYIFSLYGINNYVRSNNLIWLRL